VRNTSNNFIRSLDHSRDPRVCFEMFRDITDELFAAGTAGHSWRALRRRGPTRKRNRQRLAAHAKRLTR
jgi:hypothetical protein